MNTNLLEQGKQALENLPESYLPFIVRWLELLANTKSEMEAEDFWLLTSGELKKMADDVPNAKAVEDWRKHLNEL
jgi:hypothetical protein